MDTITGRRPFLVALQRGPRRSDQLALLAGGAVLTALVGADAALGPTTALTGIYVVAPFISATFGSVWATLVLDAIVLALGAASGIGETGYWVRLGALGVGCGFAVICAWALERSRLNGLRLRVLSDIAAIADGSLPLDETLGRVTELIVPIAADLCMVDVIHDRRVMRAAVRAAGRPDAEEIEEGIRRRTPSVPVWFVEDIPQWRHLPRFVPLMRDEDVRRMANDEADHELLRRVAPRSSISAPMIARGRSLGALTMVTAWSRRRYSPDDVRFAQILASRVALALDNAGIFSDLEGIERRMDTVMSLIDEAVVVHDAAGRLVFANLAAARWLGYESPQDMIDAPAEQVRLRYSLFDENGVPFHVGVAVPERLGRTGRPWRGMARLVFTESGEERWALVSSDAIRGPDAEPLYMVTTADDVTEVKRAEFSQRLLARTGELLASSIDYRETLARVARLAVPQFADWCAVNVPGDDGVVERVAAAHSDPERLRFAEERWQRHPAVHIDDDAAVAKVIRSGEPMIADVADGLIRERTGPGRHLPPTDGAAVGSAIVVPMTAGSRIVGALVFVNDASSRAFDPTDQALAAEIARRAGLAVANSRLASEQADVARTLQRGLLPPRLPEMEGWAAAAMYRPAGAVNEVGGDFYDAFEYADGWMVVVGDVVGRGARAASLTALARYTVRTAGMLTGDPRIALGMLDWALRNRGDAICSAVILVLPRGELDQAGVEVVSAGHPPALLLRGDGIEELPFGGPLLGALESPEWAIHRVELRPGDQLVLYTDGVTDARGRHGRFGTRQLRARLAGVASPEATVARLENALDGFVPGELTDDAAAVVVQRVAGTGAAGRAAGFAQART